MENDELNIFAKRLKELRLSLNLTQKEFADKVDLTASALSAYENNVKNPSVAVAKRIAEKINVSIDWLCGLSDKMTPNDDIVTYSDAIKAFDKLDEAFSIRINIADLAGGSLYYPVIIDPIFQDYLKEWSEILSLYHKETIDDKLYNLWIEDKAKTYNEEISDESVDLFLELKRQDEEAEKWHDYSPEWHGKRNKNNR